MFLYIGILMTIIQGGYVRRIKQGSHIKASIKAIMLLIPSFVIIALASTQFIFYLGLLFYSYASAVVIPCFTTISSNYGDEDEKGSITGIVRSLGALARAVGPIFSSISIKLKLLHFWVQDFILKFFDCKKFIGHLEPRLLILLEVLLY